MAKQRMAALTVHMLAAKHWAEGVLSAHPGPSAAGPVDDVAAEGGDLFGCRMSAGPAGRPVRGIPASESRDAVYWQDGRDAVKTERRVSGRCSPPYIPLLARCGRHAAPWISLYVAEGGAAP